MVAPEDNLQERIKNFRDCNAGPLAYLINHARFHSAQYAAGPFWPGFDK
jgi:hypothetical protein